MSRPVSGRMAHVVSAAACNAPAGHARKVSGFGRSLYPVSGGNVGDEGGGSDSPPLGGGCAETGLLRPGSVGTRLEVEQQPRERLRVLDLGQVFPDLGDAPADELELLVLRG